MKTRKVLPFISCVLCLLSLISCGQFSSSSFFSDSESSIADSQSEEEMPAMMPFNPMGNSTFDFYMTVRRNGYQGSFEEWIDSVRDVCNEDDADVLTGFGDPREDEGKNNDIYIDVLTWIYFVKEDGTWIKKDDLHSVYDDGEDRVLLVLNADGGTLPEGIEPLSFYEINLTLSLPIPEKEDCEFLGWFDQDGNEYQEEILLTRDIFLIAHWQEKKKCKVFILTGQSNASGYSYNSYLSGNYEQQFTSDYTNGFEHIHIRYDVDTENNVSEDFVSVKQGQGHTEQQFGPELGFAKTMSELYPDEEIYIIKKPYTSTCLHGNWLDENKERNVIYDHFIDYVQESMEMLSEFCEPELCGMMWMQGEYDALFGYANTYYDYLSTFVEDVREDLSDIISEDGLYFSDAGIASHWRDYSTLNGAKQTFASESDQNLYVDTINAGLTTANEPTGHADVFHYDANSEVKLGKLFAQSFIDAGVMEL